MPTTFRAACFDPAVIARSGQCFRFHPVERDVYDIFAGSDYVQLRRLSPARFSLSCDKKQYEKKWKAYFDLPTDYDAVLGAIPDGDVPLQEAARLCRGMRILRQDPWETLISFILSQRKSIPAIQGCVKKLCDRFGTPIQDGKSGEHAFPTPEALANADESSLLACGLGYRAPYVLDAARRTACGALDFNALAALSDEELLSALLRVHGVGIKVASCVLLFGFHRLRACPVDVWIQRVIDQQYGGESPFSGYGEYAGIYQQYLFFYQVDRKGSRRAAASSKVGKKIVEA